MTGTAPIQRSDERSLVRLLNAAGVPHELIEVDDYARTAEEAAQNLEAPLASIVKSLVCVAEGLPLVAMIPGDRALSFEKLDRALGLTGSKLAGRRVVERATGYVVGGVAPIGLPADVPVVGDASILSLDTLFCGAGSLRHMLRIAPGDLVRVVSVEWTDLCSPVTTA